MFFERSSSCKGFLQILAVLGVCDDKGNSARKSWSGEFSKVAILFMLCMFAFDGRAMPFIAKRQDAKCLHYLFLLFCTSFRKSNGGLLWFSTKFDQRNNSALVKSSVIARNPFWLTYFLSPVAKSMLSPLLNKCVSCLQLHLNIGTKSFTIFRRPFSFLFSTFWGILSLLTRKFRFLRRPTLMR